MLVLVLFALQAGTITAAGIQDSLEILNGCWQSDSKGTIVEERWGSVDGGLMLGTAKTVVAGRAVEFEFLKIETSKKGTIYTPFINGVAAAPFKMNETSSTTDKLVFENPSNKFPKTIIYLKNGSNMEISLSGDSSDKVEYTLAEINCSL